MLLEVHALMAYPCGDCKRFPSYITKEIICLQCTDPEEDD